MGDSASLLQPMEDPYKAAKRLNLWVDLNEFLLQQIRRHGAQVTVAAVRDWLDYMDRCAAISAAQSNGDGA